jgi:hypothetical protein
MAQGKCSFCGTFVTGGGIPMGTHSVACRECASLANKWLERHAGSQPPPDQVAPVGSPAD